MVWNGGDKEGFTPEEWKDSFLLKHKNKQTGEKTGDVKYIFACFYQACWCFQKATTRKSAIQKLGRELAGPCEPGGRTVFLSQGQRGAGKSGIIL